MNKVPVLYFWSELLLFLKDDCIVYCFNHRGKLVYRYKIWARTISQLYDLALFHPKNELYGVEYIIFKNHNRDLMSISEYPSDIAEEMYLVVREGELVQVF